MMIVPDTFSSLENFLLIGWRLAGCPWSLLYIYIWGYCDVWHLAYSNTCFSWLWEICQLHVLEPGCNEMLYWIFPHKIPNLTNVRAFIKHPEVPPLCCYALCLLNENQSWQTNGDKFVMDVWLTVHIKHTMSSHFLKWQPVSSVSYLLWNAPNIC